MTKNVGVINTKKLPVDDSEDGVQDLNYGAGVEVRDDADAVDSEGTDDEDSPIGISWKDSKEVFKQDEIKRKEAVDFVRSKEKEKRRKKNEMFLSQKRCRTSSELTRLPEEIVLAVANRAKMETNNERTEKKFVDKVKEKQKSSTKGKSKEKSQDGVKKHGHYKVLVIEDEVKKPKKIEDSAAAFLENHLYGDRLQRTSPTSNLTSRSKSAGKMKPAIKFSNKV